MAENASAGVKDPSKSVPDFSNWSCPLPLVGYPTIVMGTARGKLGNELVEHLFLPAFRNPVWKIWAMRRCRLPAGRLAMSTDPLWCSPCFFPAINWRAGRERTVNDLAFPEQTRSF